MFKVLTKGCEPTKGSKFSACIDLYASEDCTICAGETKLIGLGIAIDLAKLKVSYRGDLSDRDLIILIGKERFDSQFNEFLNSHYLQLMLRSSLGKKGLILPNGVGIIDLDYEDEIKMIIHNPIKNGTGASITVKQDDEYSNVMRFYGFDYEIKKGDRIAQITLLEHKASLFGVETDAVREGGFGSTDKENKNV